MTSSMFRRIIFTLVLTGAHSGATAVEDPPGQVGGTEGEPPNRIQRTRRTQQWKDDEYWLRQRIIAASQCGGVQFEVPAYTELEGVNVCFDPGTAELDHYVECWRGAFNQTFYDDNRDAGARIEALSVVDYRTVDEEEEEEENLVEGKGQGGGRKLRTRRKAIMRQICRGCCEGRRRRWTPTCSLNHRDAELLGFDRERKLQETGNGRKLNFRRMPGILMNCLLTHPSFEGLNRCQITLGREANEEWANGRIDGVEVCGTDASPMEIDVSPIGVALGQPQGVTQAREYEKGWEWWKMQVQKKKREDKWLS